jgi:hypothetical protein
MAIGGSGRPIGLLQQLSPHLSWEQFSLSLMESGVLGELAHEFRLAQGAFVMRSSWVNTGTLRSESIIVPFVETR